VGKKIAVAAVGGLKFAFKHAVFQFRCKFLYFGIRQGGYGVIAFKQFHLVVAYKPDYRAAALRRFALKPVKQGLHFKRFGAPVNHIAHLHKSGAAAAPAGAPVDKSGVQKQFGKPVIVAVHIADRHHGPVAARRPPRTACGTAVNGRFKRSC